MEDADIESITVVIRDPDRTMLRTGQLNHRHHLVLAGREYLSNGVSVEGERVQLTFAPTGRAQ